MSKNIWDMGEDIAVRYLTSKGFEIVERNFRVFGGEIDIIAKKEELYVFVEVKMRKNVVFSHPLDLWTQQKIRPFLRAMYEYMEKYDIDEEHCRIDFIGILPNKQSWKMFHVEGVEI